MSTFQKGDLLIFSHETDHIASVVSEVNAKDDSIHVILFLRNDERFGNCLLNAIQEEGDDIHELLRRTNMLKEDMAGVFNDYFRKDYIIASAHNMNPNGFTRLTPEHIDLFPELHPYRELLLIILNKKPGRAPTPQLHL